MNVWMLPLLPFSWIYAAVMRLRNMAYDQGWKKVHSAGIPVISVGNITIGGTGKTPMAEFLLRRLLEMGCRPGYLSRGYGRKSRGYFLVKRDMGGAGQFGDEAFQVAHRFPSVPIAVCEDRVAGARQLLAAHEIDILVMDDAFQHRRIHRSVDIVMVDVTRPPISDRVLPMGRLREPLSGLKRADVIVLSKFQNPGMALQMTDDLGRRFPKAEITRMEMKPKAIIAFFPSNEAPMEIAMLNGRDIVAFSGLGNNAHFRSTLEGMGAHVSSFLSFPDHHPYSEGDMEEIMLAFDHQREIKGNLTPSVILTTEKDYFRLIGLPWMNFHASRPIYYLEVEMSPMEGWERVDQNIRNIARKI
jgi:tetraacyldisaccharide 4'-kinase